MSEIDNALARLDASNTDPYSSSNPYGLTGRGAMPANWVPGLRAVATVYRAIVTLNSSLNFLAAQASVATLLQRCQDLVAQVTAGSTTALAFPSLDKLLLSTPNAVQVYVYDTRLDDLTADVRRWNEPGRCSAMSYWSEAQGVYRGVKRDFPAVALIIAAKEQWWIYDALDLDPVTGAPRLWAASNPTGNGLVLCGITAPITSVYARNGYIYFGSGMGLHVISLTGDWCDRYDNQGRRRRLGTFAQRNTVLAEGGVIASGALPATAIIGVHAHVYPGAPLDPAGMPIPTILALTAAGASIIHPNGLIVTLSDAFGFAFGSFLCDGRISLTRGDQLVFIGPLPYASASAATWAHVIHSTAAAPAVLNNGAGNAIRITDGAEGGAAGLTFRAHDASNFGAGMVAYATTAYATGWQPGDVRLAALCDATTGAITGGANVVSNGDFGGDSTAGWTGVGATLSASGGAMTIMSSGTPGTAPASRTTISVVAGLTYVISFKATSPAGRSPSYWQASGSGLSAAVSGVAASPGAGETPVIGQFTAAASGNVTVDIYEGNTTTGAGVAAIVKSVSIKSGLADRGYKGKGLTVAGTLQRAQVATGADVVAWSGWSAADFLERPADADLQMPGDFMIALAVSHSGLTLFRSLLGTYNGGQHYELSLLPDHTVQLSIADASGGDTLSSTAALTAGSYGLVVAGRRGATLEIWIDGVLCGRKTTTRTGTIATPDALRTGRRGAGVTAYPASGCALTLARVGGYMPTAAQIRRMTADEAPLFQPGAKALLAGTSNVVACLSRDPLTCRLAVGTGDGVSVFAGLRRVAYYDADVLAATTSDTVRSVALRGGHLLIGTAAEVGFVADAVGGKEAIAVGGPRPVGGSFVARGVTVDATPLDLAPRVPVGERETVLIEARIVGRVYGTADTERLSYIRRATIYRDTGGNVTLQGSVQTIGTDTEATSTADATLAIDTAAQTVAARVTGVASKRIAWRATFTVTRVSEETSYVA